MCDTAGGATYTPGSGMRCGEALVWVGPGLLREHGLTLWGMGSGGVSRTSRSWRSHVRASDDAEGASGDG